MINVRWFSPLDPEKNDIARYAHSVLPSLHKCFRLGMVSEGPDSIDEDENGEAFQCDNQVVGMEPINIYNIGNSHMHCSILNLALRQPGVVILHDVGLFELSLAYARKNADFSIRDVIINEYGLQAVHDFDQMFGGSAYDWHGHSQEQHDNFLTSYPLFKSFISNARGVVVHSEFALKRVKKIYQGPVVKLELPWATPLSGVTARRHEEPCQIVFCGHAGPNRRLRQFIQAWSETSQPSFFRFSLYGAIDKADEIIALAAEFGLAEFINVVGFVSVKELDDAISASHIALNLRKPTVGETSGSQLRHWATAIPSIVTDIGWYSEQPHDVVIKVSPDREKQDIVSILEKFISGDHPYYEYGMNGYKHLLEEHSIDRYVSRLADFVGEIEKRRFVTSEVDERLVDLFASMCSDTEDSHLFENAMKKISETFNGVEQIQPNN